MHRYARLLISVSLPLLAGFIGSLATTPAIPTWYASLAKPIFNPPNWLFGPVWTTLYLLMGIAFYRIWSLGWHQTPVRRAAITFLVHLVLNSLWSIAFFGYQSPSLGLAVILPLLLLIIIITRRFYHLDKPAAFLLFPYIAWVSFATLLNASIWYLN